MTDKQLYDIFISRASEIGKNYGNLQNPRVVFTQQYCKKLYFAIMFDNSSPFYILFNRSGKSMVFALPELPERLVPWKHSVISSIFKQKTCPSIPFDLSTTPKEIQHIFFSALITALNTPGMGVSIIATDAFIFSPNETYEEIAIEADLVSIEP